MGRFLDKPPEIKYMTEEEVIKYLIEVSKQKH